MVTKLIQFQQKMVKIVKLASNGVSMDDIAHLALSALKDGKVIALPTDTIYGISSLAQNNAAVKRIYSLKRRDCNKPVAICVGHISDVFRWGKVVFPKEILQELLPGPVTLLMEPQSTLNENLNPGASLVGIRIPRNSFIQKLALMCDEPLALTSANVSSMSNALAIQEFKDIWPDLDLIFDGGVLGKCDPNRLGSTVVDLSVEGCFKIRRPGCSLEDTRNILLRYNLEEIL